MSSQRKGVVFISDNPMTLGIQFLLGHMLDNPQLRSECDFSGVFSSATDYAHVESAYSDDERRHLIQFLQSRSPMVVGISTIERTRERLPALLRDLKSALPETMFVAGGVDAVSSPDYYFGRGADLVVMGDGEVAAEELLLRLVGGQSMPQLLSDPPAGIHTARRAAPKPASSPRVLPLPYYGPQLFRLTGDGIGGIDHNASNPEHVQFVNRRFAIDMFTQRGCTHECAFCAQDLLLVYRDDAKRNSRRRSLRDVVEFIANVKSHYPYKNAVYFWDLDFLRKPREELLQFARLYQEQVALPFFIFVTEKTVNSAGAAVIAALAGAGMKTINMGIQSGSARVLKVLYNRNNTPEECRRAIATIHEATKESKIEILYDVITYNPDETVEDLLDTVRLVADIPTDGKQTIRLSTHKLSFNSGQALKNESNIRTFEDYQDFVSNEGMYERTQSPYLSWLVGKLMRGIIGASSIGSIKRRDLPNLIDRNLIKQMDGGAQHWGQIFRAFIPRENETFI